VGLFMKIFAVGYIQLASEYMQLAVEYRRDADRVQKLSNPDCNMSSSECCAVIHHNMAHEYNKCYTIGIMRNVMQHATSKARTQVAC
jgi:hypothetical protein